MEMKRIGIGNYLFYFPIAFIPFIILKKSDEISYQAFHHFFNKIISREIFIVLLHERLKLLLHHDVT